MLSQQQEGERIAELERRREALDAVRRTGDRQAAQAAPFLMPMRPQAEQLREDRRYDARQQVASPFLGPNHRPLTFSPSP